MMRWMAGFVAVALVVSACTSASTPTATSSPPPTVAPTTTSTTTTSTVPTDPGIVSPVVRTGAEDNVIYFVMTDRFANGDPSNDTGGIDGGPLEHGYLPTDNGYYHGGDLIGLIEQLDYIAGLGATAIWITPPFTNRAVQGGGNIANSSAGYHGYWQIDYTRVDPHLGTNDDLKRLVEEANRRGMNVFLDAVTNHTGDVIVYEGGQFGYKPKGSNPYRDAGGQPFDDAAFAGSDDFPELDPAVSFPLVPTFLTPADATVKAPDFLNDLTNYHNRGSSTFTGENSLYGDFFGLDDLFTEKPEVVEGMIGIYTNVVEEFGVDGFRVDTVKHVNDEFWAEWVPAVLGTRDGLFLFGEVFGESPPFRAHYTTDLPFPSVLDFGFNDAVTAFAASGLGANVLASHFEDDDWFTDADSNAHQLVKFAGNHDIGRIGSSIARANVGADDVELLDRMKLAFATMFLTRGVPVVYYGDEQGFTGDGGDKAARHDMFPSVTESYLDDDMIGTEATPGDDNFDTAHPLYEAIAELAELRADHRALASGAQVTRLAAEGVFAFSRIDPVEQIEYLVVVSNNEALPFVTFEVATPGAAFIPLLGDTGLTSTSDGTISMSVPSLSYHVFVADRPMPQSEAPAVELIRPTAGATIELPRFLVEADVDAPGHVAVTFALVIDGEVIILGTDDSPPYRAPWNTAGLAPGTAVEIVATAVDAWGSLAVDRVLVTMGETG